MRALAGEVNLVLGLEDGEHDVVLTLHGKGVEAFAFTFGTE